MQENHDIIKKGNRGLNRSGYPENKLIIVGGGIVGFLEAYYAYLNARQRGERIRVPFMTRTKR